jgi:hypothetical protein
MPEARRFFIPGIMVNGATVTPRLVSLEMLAAIPGSLMLQIVFPNPQLWVAHNDDI